MMNYYILRIVREGTARALTLFVNYAITGVAEEMGFLYMYIFRHFCNSSLARTIKIAINFITGLVCYK